MGVPLGLTLNDWFAVGLHGYGPPLTLKNGLLYRARYYYRVWGGLPSSPIPKDMPKGRILLTSLGSAPHLVGLVLPIVERLGPGASAVIGNDPTLVRSLSFEEPFLAWTCATSPRNAQWSSEYRRCRKAWHKTLRNWILRRGLPPALFAPLAYTLLLRSYQVAGSLELLRRIKPRGVVTEADRNELASCLILAARSLGIPTLTMMHGVINPPYGFTPLLADVALCWGAHQRDTMVKLGTPKERLAVTGCQRLQRGIEISRENACARMDVCSNRPVVLLASSAVSASIRRRLARMFCEALGEREDLSAVVRLHPSEQLGFYQDEIAEFPTVRFLESRPWPVGEALAVADIVVCQNSGLGNDALIGRRLVIVVDVPGDCLRNGLELVEKAGCPMVKSSEELAREVSAILSDDERRSELTERREQYVHQFCEFFGDEATARVVLEIEGHVSRETVSVQT